MDHLNEKMVAAMSGMKTSRKEEPTVIQYLSPLRQKRSSRRRLRSPNHSKQLQTTANNSKLPSPYIKKISASGYVEAASAAHSGSPITITAVITPNAGSRWLNGR